MHFQIHIFQAYRWWMCSVLQPSRVLSRSDRPFCQSFWSGVFKLLKWIDDSSNHSFRWTFFPSSWPSVPIIWQASFRLYISLIQTGNSCINCCTCSDRFLPCCRLSNPVEGILFYPDPVASFHRPWFWMMPLLRMNTEFSDTDDFKFQSQVVQEFCLRGNQWYDSWRRRLKF